MTPNTKISTLFTQTDRKIVIDKLKNNPLLSVRFRFLKGELKERMIDFLCGTATLPLTYDPFFKKLFNPDIYPERLENFISSVLKKKVKDSHTMISKKCIQLSYSRIAPPSLKRTM